MRFSKAEYGLPSLIMLGVGEISFIGGCAISSGGLLLNVSNSNLTDKLFTSGAISAGFGLASLIGGFIFVRPELYFDDDPEDDPDDPDREDIDTTIETRDKNIQTEEDFEQRLAA